MNRITYALALLVVLALVAAGCGGGSSSSSNSAYGGGSGSKQASSEETAESTAKGGYGEGAETSAGGAGVVTAVKVGDLGMVLVDSKGLTLYDFHKDKGSTSSCYGACAGTWPPLLTEGEPQAEGGAQAAMLGTTKRKDGTVQVTYNGWPLYTYLGDKGPGEANGNDFSQFGAQWYALMPNGQEPQD